MKPGDLVEVKTGVWDDSMPDNRRDGMIVEVFSNYLHPSQPDQAVVMFSNGAFLKFHKSQLNFLVKL